MTSQGAKPKHRQLKSPSLHPIASNYYVRIPPPFGPSRIPNAGRLPRAEMFPLSVEELVYKRF